MRELMAGNDRFRRGASTHHIYTPQRLKELTAGQSPLAVVVACSDSRVSPEVIFDQPLGGLFSCRVPGNIAGDGSRWAVEMAVNELKVPIVMVLGHTGCLAIAKFLDGDAGGAGGAGGMHRFNALNAVYRAKAKQPEDLYRASVEENVVQSLEHLVRDIPSLKDALLSGATSCVAAVYEMDHGHVVEIPHTLASYRPY